MPRPEYLVGLDLAQSIDYSALCVAEVIAVADGARAPVPGSIGQSRTGAVIPITRPKVRKVLQVRHLERLRQGLSYPAQVDRVAELLNAEPLRSSQTTLVLDRSGIGRAISDLIEVADLSCDLALVTITGGDTEARDGYQWSVPKRNLISACQVLLQQGRLRIAAGLPLAGTLADELSAYQIKISASGHDSYSAPSGLHDDILIAVSLIAWFGGDVGETDFW